MKIPVVIEFIFALAVILFIFYLLSIIFKDKSIPKLNLKGKN